MTYREPDLSPWLEDFQEEEPFLMDVPPMGPAPDPWELPEFETPRGDRFAALLDELMASRMEPNAPEGFLDRFAMGLQANPPQMQGRPNNGLEAFLGGLIPSAAQGFSQGRVASRGLATPDLSGRMEMLKLAGMGATQEGQDNARKMSAALRQQGIRSGVEKAAVPKMPAPFDPASDPQLQRERTMRKEGLGSYREKPGKGAGNTITLPDGTQITSAGGLKPPTASEREAIAKDLTALEQVQAIGKLVKDEYLGPSSAARGLGAKLTDRALKSGEADFKGALAIYRNAVINALSGAAVSAAEAKRMEQQIPNSADPPGQFRAKMKETEANVRRVASIRRDTYSRTGIDLSGLAPLPSSTIRMIAPDGKVWEMDASEQAEAEANGYRVAP